MSPSFGFSCPSLLVSHPGCEWLPELRFCWAAAVSLLAVVLPALFCLTSILLSHPTLLMTSSSTYNDFALLLLVLKASGHCWYHPSALHPVQLLIANNSLHCFVGWYFGTKMDLF